MLKIFQPLMICNPMDILSGFVIPFPIMWISNPPRPTNGLQICWNGVDKVTEIRPYKAESLLIAQGVSPGSPAVTQKQALKERHLDA